MNRALAGGVVIVLLALTGCGGAARPDPVTALSSPTAATTPVSASTPPSTPIPSASTPAPTPSAAWTPCDLSAEPSLGGCEHNFFMDTCDASYYHSEVGSLLDSFIEDKNQVDAKRLKDCLRFLPTWRKALNGVREGSLEVGSEIKAGTYETTAHLDGGEVQDCYWERSGPNGRIIANNFVTATRKVRVTVRASDEMFTSRGCGNWLRVSG